jgi:hypothetical protein
MQGNFINIRYAKAPYSMFISQLSDTSKNVELGRYFITNHKGILGDCNLILVIEVEILSSKPGHSEGRIQLQQRIKAAQITMTSQLPSTFLPANCIADCVILHQAGLFSK